MPRPSPPPSVVSPPTLAALRDIPDPADRAQASKAYVTQRIGAIREATDIRDAAIRELLDLGHGVTAVSRLCEVSTSTVKLARNVRPAPQRAAG